MLRRSKAWWLSRIDREPNVTIGAGVIRRDIEDSSNSVPPRAKETTMKTYIGIKAVLAEQMDARTADAQNLIRNAEHLDANTPGYAVTYADGYRSWSPATAFENANREVPHADSAEILFDTIEYLEDRIAGPVASEDDGHCPEVRRVEALRIACATPLPMVFKDADIVARARAFEQFIAGEDAAPPRAAGATVDFNEMLECTDGSLWAQAYIQQHGAGDNAPLTLDEMLGLLTHWFGNAIEAGRANGYKEALFQEDDAPIPEFPEVDEAPQPYAHTIGKAPVDPRLGQPKDRIADTAERPGVGLEPDQPLSEAYIRGDHLSAKASDASLDDEPVGDAPEDDSIPGYQR